MHTRIKQAGIHETPSKHPHAQSPSHFIGTIQQSRNYGHQQKFSIAIVGGGVCGLTLAAGLQKHGLKAHIYESAVSLQSTSVFRVLV